MFVNRLEPDESGK